MCGGSGDGGAAEAAARERKLREEAAQIRIDTMKERERYREERLRSASGGSSRRRDPQFGGPRYGGERRGTITGESLIGRRTEIARPERRGARTEYRPAPSYATTTTPFGLRPTMGPTMNFAGKQLPSQTYGYMKNGKFYTQQQLPRNRFAWGGIMGGQMYQNQLNREGYRPVYRVDVPAETAVDYEKRLKQWNAEQAKLNKQNATLLGSARDRAVALGNQAEQEQRYSSMVTSGESSGDRRTNERYRSGDGQGQDVQQRRTEAETSVGISTSQRRIGPFIQSPSVGS